MNQQCYGGGAGLLLPIVGTSVLGASGLGAVTNMAGYVATQAYDGQAISGAGLVVSGFAGAAGGWIAGPLSNPYWFAKNTSAWLADAAMRNANLTKTAVGRALAGAFAGNANPCTGK